MKTTSTQGSAIAPLLNVRRGGEAVEFYKRAFGAVETYRVESPDGEVVATLAIDGAEFWVADESPEHGNFSPESLARRAEGGQGEGGEAQIAPRTPQIEPVPRGTVRMILVVADPDAAFDRAVAAGATVVFPVGEGHGWRLGRVVDPYGHHWEIGRKL